MRRGVIFSCFQPSELKLRHALPRRRYMHLINIFRVTMFWLNWDQWSLKNVSSLASQQGLAPTKKKQRFFLTFKSALKAHTQMEKPPEKSDYSFNVVIKPLALCEMKKMTSRNRYDSLPITRLPGNNTTTTTITTTTTRNGRFLAFPCLQKTGAFLVHL